MKNPLIAFALPIALALSGVANAEEPELASDRYLAYLDALAKAERFEEIVPYWARWMEKSAKSRSRRERREKLESLQQEAGERTKVYISGAAGDGASTVLRVGGRAIVEEGGEQVELYLSGEVVMIRENGRWVIDSESWWSE